MFIVAALVIAATTFAANPPRAAAPSLPKLPTAAATPSPATAPTTSPAQPAGDEEAAAGMSGLAPRAGGGESFAGADPAGTQPSTRPSTGPAIAPVPTSRPPLRPTTMPVDIVSDAEIDAAIRRGTDVLLDQFDRKTARLRRRASGPRYAAFECGLNALCVYALLEAHQATGDPRLKRGGANAAALIDGMKRMRADAGMHQTYARAIRATALAVFNRPEDRKQLEEDAGALAAGNDYGAYGYVSAVPASFGFRFNGPSGNVPGLVRGWYDNSNSQYGLLGVWSGAEVGVDASDKYWRDVDTHWTSCQRAEDGRWTYKFHSRSDEVGHAVSQGRPSHTMTAAGMVSVLVAREYLELVEPNLKVGRDPFPPAFAAALPWWEHRDNAIDLREVDRPGSTHWGYALYGVERVGLASGLKYFGANDWYRMLARRVIDRQHKDGSWGNLPDTAYALLFLARGRHPILMNKLRFGPPGDPIVTEFWNNRPRDAANLARHARLQLERVVNWQVVPVDRPTAADWMDSPVLYIASHKPPRLKPADYDKIREFAEWGGMIFTQTDQGDVEDGIGLPRPGGGAPGGRPADPLSKYLKKDKPRSAAPAAAGTRGAGDDFDAFVERLAAQLFPNYRYADIPPGHPVYSSVYRLDPAAAPLKGVSNGSRLLLVHSPRDVARAWQARDLKAGRPQFELGVNLFVYAAGKREYRNRLDSPFVPAPPAGAPLPVGTVTVARLQYSGNWLPEPAAWPRFARRLYYDTGFAADVRDVTWADLKAGDARVAHLTGTARYEPRHAEVAALRAFVAAGGVALVDDCGGGGAFASSLRPILAAGLAPGAFRRLPAAHPLLNAVSHGTADLRDPRLRLFNVETKHGVRDGVEILSLGKGHVLLTPHDVTTGLLGANTWGVGGYEPAYADALARNVLFWAVDGQPGGR